MTCPQCGSTHIDIVDSGDIFFDADHAQVDGSAAHWFCGPTTRYHYTRELAYCDQCEHQWYLPSRWYYSSETGYFSEECD